jgi:hypothetical protein
MNPSHPDVNASGCCFAQSLWESGLQSRITRVLTSPVMTRGWYEEIGNLNLRSRNARCQDASGFAMRNHVGFLMCSGGW